MLVMKGTEKYAQIYANLDSALNANLITVIEASQQAALTLSNLYLTL